jgi:uncharacterized membrane protein YhaH (DUF805 family)
MDQNIYKSPESNVQHANVDIPSMSVKDLLFSFQGRIGRGKYWAGLLGTIVVLGATMIFLIKLGVSEELLNIVLIMLNVPLIWIWLAVPVKRWHDRNKSGWWIFISFIPIIGPIWAFIENGLLAGDRGANNYGPPPK